MPDEHRSCSHNQLNHYSPQNFGISLNRDLPVDELDNGGLTRCIVQV